MRQVNLADVLGGAVVIGFGGVFAAVAASYPLGTPIQPGPGSFPLVVGLITAAIGIGIVIRGFVLAEPVAIQFKLRPVIAVLAAIAAFGLLIGRVGLIPTLFVMVLIAAAGSRQSRPAPALLVALATSLGAWLIFIAGLGLPIPALRMPF